MSHVTLTIQTNTVAFEGENLGRELARILREVAGRAEQGELSLGSGFDFRDINGNKVGEADHHHQDDLYWGRFPYS